MKHHRYTIGLLVLLILSVVMPGCTKDEQRGLTLDDFAFLKSGISLQEITQVVGEPDTDVGSGAYMPVYYLKDNGVVSLQFGGDPTNLLSAVYSHPDGEAIILVEFEPVESPPKDSTFEINAELQCETVLEVQWGNGPENWGFCPEPNGAIIPGPYPPVVGRNGEIFILDKANQRILVYHDFSKAPQIIEIDSEFSLFGVCDYTSPGWSNIAVSDDHIFLQFAKVKDNRYVEQITVYRMDGQLETVLDLEPYYPSRSSPRIDMLVVDQQGGVYTWILPGGLVHFGNSWQPTFIPLSDLNYLDNMRVGWNGHRYTYNNTEDRLVDWGERSVGFRYVEVEVSFDDVIKSTIPLSTHAELIGVDIDEQKYFKVWGHMNYEGEIQRVLMRMTESGESLVADVPGISLVLSPTGEFYSVSYDFEDTSVEPELIRCVLSPNEVVD